MCPDPWRPMWAIAASSESTTPTARIRSRYSVSQSSAVAGVIDGTSARLASSPRSSTPASARAVGDAREERRGDRAVDEQGLGGVADAGALGLGVHDDADGHLLVGRGVDVDVAVARVVLQDRHLGLVDDPADQALAAAGDGQVDQVGQLQAGGRRPRGRWSRRAGRRRRGRPEPGRASARTRCRARLVWIASLPPRRIAALPLLTQSAAASAVTFGPALVDHEDHAQRDADPGHVQAVRPPARLDHLADRVGQVGDLDQRLADPVEPLRVERQAVDRRGVQPEPRARARRRGRSPPGSRRPASRSPRPRRCSQRSFASPFATARRPRRGLGALGQGAAIGLQVVGRRRRLDHLAHRTRPARLARLPIVACTASQLPAPKRGPDLDRVGHRADVVDPDDVRPGDGGGERRDDRGRRPLVDGPAGERAEEALCARCRSGPRNPGSQIDRGSARVPGCASNVLPNPIPGSSAIRSRAIPAASAASTRRARNS